MATFGTSVTTTTQDKLLPKVVDTILNGNVLATRILSSPKKWVGEDLKVPVKYKKNTNGGSFDGFDTFATDATDNRVNMSFDPRFYRKTVSLPLTDVSINDVSESRVLDLIALELEGAAEDMADDIGTLFYGDGTGNGSKDFLGLGALVDDGTTVANIGGLARSTYTTLKGTVTASGGTISLAKMTTLYNAVASGMQKPTIALCDETVFGLVEQLVQPMQQINMVAPVKGKGQTGQTGFTSLMHKGVPIVQDEKATAQTFFFVNEDYLDWHGLPVAMTKPVPFAPGNYEGNDYANVIRNLGFSWSEWIKPSNAAAIVAHVYLGGNLITRNPKRHGKLTGVTSV